MNDDSLKRMFDALPSAPRAEAKARARAAALQAFDAVHADTRTIAVAQGSAQPQRPTSDDTKQGSNVMYATIARKPQPAWQYVGLAAAAMLILGGVITQLARQKNDTAPQSVEVKQPEEKLRSESRMADRPPKPLVASKTETTGTEAAIAGAPPALVPPEPTSSKAPALRIAAAPSAESRVLKSTSGPQGPATTPVLPAEEVLVTAQRRRETVNEIGMSIQSIEPQTTISYSTQATVVPSPVRTEVGPESRDRFATTASNAIKKVSAEPVSTFSIDVDTASYSFVRRQLNAGVLPEKNAVRLEEMVNYFPYAYPLPQEPRRPFSTQVTVIDSPWKPGNKLLHIGIKGYALPGKPLKSNLVFLLDVSGSMNSPDKLPLVKQSMELLLTQLQPEDTVAIVVYAGAAGTVLAPTAVREKEKILAALNELSAGGSTAGGQGIVSAYQLAESGFIKDGVNRVILATDGDFNVGITDPAELQSLIERKRKSGVFLSVLGFGQGNYNDELMQKLAQNGNGIAAYIDSLSEARKVLVDEARSTLLPIAKDVKIQVEFNPKTVSEYRLLGYETRMLSEEDFNNDAVDAGDVGSGHTVTALYEITPMGSASGALSPSRYADKAEGRGRGKEYGFLKLRYKLPTGVFSKRIEAPIRRDAKPDDIALQETRFAVAVAGFAQLLQGGKYLGDWSYDDALELAAGNRGDDTFGYRSELLELIRKAKLADSK